MVLVVVFYVVFENENNDGLIKIWQVNRSHHWLMNFEVIAVDKFVVVIIVIVIGILSRSSVIFVISIQECPRGFYCPESSSQPQSCPPGTFNPDPQGQSIDYCQDCFGGKFCNGSSLAEPSGG